MLIVQHCTLAQINLFFEKADNTTPIIVDLNPKHINTTKEYLQGF